MTLESFDYFFFGKVPKIHFHVIFNKDKSCNTRTPTIFGTRMDKNQLIFQKVEIFIDSLSNLGVLTPFFLHTFSFTKSNKIPQKVGRCAEYARVATSRLFLPPPTTHTPILTSTPANCSYPYLLLLGKDCLFIVLKQLPKKQNWDVSAKSFLEV